MKNETLELLKTQLAKWLSRKTLQSSVRRVGELPLTIGSDIGQKRSENQDRVAVLKFKIDTTRSILVAALCDGMGGMDEGSACAAHTLASFLAACCTSEDISPKERVIRASHDANRVVHSLFHGKGGATLSAVLLDSKKGIVGVNVGDSRIYIFRDKVLSQVTIDDTIAGLLPKVDHNTPPRNELLQFIGIGDGLDPHPIELNVFPELIVLTSDGVHFMEKELLQGLIRNASNQGVAARRIIEVAQWSSGHDNASIIIVAPAFDNLLKLEETEAVQIWDPFGELQVIAAGPINSLPKNGPLSLLPPVIDKAPRKTSPKKKGKTKSSKQRESEIGDSPPPKETEAEKNEPKLKILFDISNKVEPDEND